MASTSLPHDHTGQPTARSRRIVVLGSQDYGAVARTNAGRLPYRIDELRSAGIEVTWSDRHLHGPLGSGRPGRVVRRTEAVLTPWAQAVATRRLRRDAAAVLAIFESEGHGLAARRWLPFGAAPGTPLVIIGCWLADLLRNGGAVRRHLYALLYRKVDRVVVFSSNQAATLERFAGIDPARVAVVRFGVDLDELAGRPTTESGTVVAAGRDLGRDWATLAAAAHDSGWRVELMTRPAQVAGLDLPSEIQVLGAVDRTSYLDRLAAATVVAIPTEVREYPTGQTVLLEAMALGKACVVTDTPAMREYVEDGRTGVLVPPGDAAALRDAIDRLLDDEQERRRLGDNARDDAISHGGASRMWTEIGSILHEVIDAAQRVRR